MEMNRWIAMLLGLLSLKRIKKEANTESDSSSYSSSSLQRSGPLAGSEGCLTPRGLNLNLKRPKWLKSRDSRRRAALLRLDEEEYRKQEDLLWDNDEDSSSGAVWQRTIMMGEKCEPPAFSGLILYDERGNRVPEFPMKSPRSPLHRQGFAL